MNDTPTPANSNGARRRGLFVFAVLVVLGGIAYTTYWLAVARHYETTDDAYVASDIVQITGEVPGTVIAIHVDDTQAVTRGQPLLELDPADARIAAASAEAELARAVRQVRALYAQVNQLQAQIEQRETELSRAVDDFNRRQTLVADGAVSAEELAHTRDTITTLRAGLVVAREQLDATAAQTDGTTVATHPQVLAAAAKVREAALALHRTNIVAPVAGVVARRAVQIGQRVAAGAPLMAVIPLDDVWVDANFKEVQLDRMRVGQPVAVHADLYGGSVDFHGRIAGLSAGSGSAFALLPPQNASGNWIKIVQRLPVRIALDAQEVKAHPLRIGLSMQVRVDIRDASGPLVATQLRNTPLPTQASDGDDPALDARIAKIIRNNSGAGAAVVSTRDKGDAGVTGAP